MNEWHGFTFKGRLGRFPFFFVTLVIGLVAVAGGYLFRWWLTSDGVMSPFYLEITLLWSILVLAVFFPFAVQRARDVGISIWWTLLLWLQPFFDFKFMLLFNKYMGYEINL